MLRNRVLLIATLFEMPYRVLRCAEAAGAEVYVLGTAGARPLRYSRYCRDFFLSDCIINGERDDALALETNCLVKDLGITTVLAADAPSTRSLIATRDLIETQCFPLPSLETFDLLNDKWEFAKLCQELDILHPKTRLLPDRAALAAELGRCAEHPIIVKPLGRSGNGGVVVFDGVDHAKRLKTINYRPLLVQEFIRGEDIGASIFARGGRIHAFVAHKFWHQAYSTFRDDQTYERIASVARRFNLEGIYNFDMRRSADGLVYFLECNPRVFHKIALSMIAGINFVRFGLSGMDQAADIILADVKVRLPKALAHALITSARCTRRDWAMARYLYADPIPYLIEKLKLAV